jgi:hypothetical protein
MIQMQTVANEELLQVEGGGSWLCAIGEAFVAVGHALIDLGHWLFG